MAKRLTIPETPDESVPNVELPAELAEDAAEWQRTGRRSARLQRFCKRLLAHPEMNSHKQVLIRHGRQSTHVDEKIAPLILETWRAGIATIFSCEDFGQDWPKGTVQIGFLRSTGLRRWLAITTKKETQKTFPHHDISNCGPITSVRPYWTSTGAIELKMTVYFPDVQLPYFVRRLRSYNARKRH